MNASPASAAVVVRRTIAASAEVLFDAWLDPIAVATWMRPGEILRTVATIDARVGGRYEITMSSQSQDYPTTGTYLEIERPRRLVFTWESAAKGPGIGETLVTVEFLAKGKATEIVVTHERLPDSERESHRDGWTSGLGKFEEYACRR